MVSSAATSVTQYLDELPPDRKRALSALRSKLKRALPRGFVEVIQYGMISYIVPLAVFPKTYNRQPLAVLSLASQKQHMALYLSGLYGDAELRGWFERAYEASGKRLDMGKSCLRFKAIDDLALDIVLEAVSKVDVDDLIAMHEAAHGASGGKAVPKKKAAGATTAAARKRPARKTA